MHTLKGRQLQSMERQSSIWGDVSKCEGMKDYDHSYDVAGLCANKPGRVMMNVWLSSFYPPGPKWYSLSDICTLLVVLESASPSQVAAMRCSFQHPNQHEARRLSIHMDINAAASHQQQED